jgi:hypothetical protein
MKAGLKLRASEGGREQMGRKNFLETAKKWWWCNYSLL